MRGKLSVEIVTQEGVPYQGEVEGVVAPGVGGYFGVLPRHAPLIAELGVGDLRLREGAEWEHFALAGGIFHVRDGVAVVLADAVEAAEEIDVQRAQEAHGRAIHRLRLAKGGPDVDVERAKAALMRALNRLRIAGAKPIDT